MAKIFLKCGLLIRQKNSSEIYGIFLMPILKGEGQVISDLV